MGKDRLAKPISDHVRSQRPHICAPNQLNY